MDRYIFFFNLKKKNSVSQSFQNNFLLDSDPSLEEMFLF